jgi:hypothetical protein
MTPHNFGHFLTWGWYAELLVGINLKFSQGKAGARLRLCLSLLINIFRDVKKDWCLIHNAHLGKILSFCKILDLKITHIKNFFTNIFV